MISIPSNLLEDIFAHARREAPHEICGWLAGFAGESGKTQPASPKPRRERSVELIYPVPNASEGPKARFVMEPEAQLSAMRKIRELGLELVGTYHSHPRSPAHPSERDRELALYPDLAHLIVSLSDGEARCFRISEGKNIEMKVERKPRLV